MKRFFVTTADRRRLSCVSVGAADTLVLFEAGLGMGARYWGPVTRMLAEDYQCVSYDRSGFGSSDPDPQPRTLDRLADDLMTVVGRIPHRVLILVGHSWGGPIIRAACARPGYSDRIAGLVLVDPSDETLTDEYAAWQLALMRPLTVLAARVKLLGRSVDPLVRGLPDDDRRVLLASCTTVSAAREVSSELKEFLPELRRLDGVEPHVPTVLISGATTDRGGREAIAARPHPPGASDERATVGRNVHCGCGIGPSCSRHGTGAHRECGA
ncbi:alpha/beta hydrolase [Actinomyces sp. B33]|uniref:alpha/beta fold hydrolase n=1 Tax=Actinomyces sp. B33 TaxID=2942131 RepID=UPI0023410EE3|nr:alpha/beta fold hydrolase [Actinomyces sp. B33]MDC4233133.1 alpha/beta hydrolase [Actinomyces sp. B33]